ncbi:hypothetical protein U1Q18_026637 [Sarracenia purpurea var. burkii]
MLVFEILARSGSLKSRSIAIGGGGAKAQTRWRRIVLMYESSMDDKFDLWFSTILRFCKSYPPLRTDSKSPRMCGDVVAVMIDVPTGEERWSDGGAVVAGNGSAGLLVLEGRRLEIPFSGCSRR